MISVNNLSYQFPSGKNIQFPDIHLNRGDQCLLLGESGTGKTTLLHLIGGFLKIQQGDVIIDQVNIRTLSESATDHFRGKKIGFIFQRNHLMSALSVKNNLMLPAYLAGLPADRDKVKKVLADLGMQENFGSAVTELSQGQMQRVAIARAVLNNPSVILADEPTSSLDDTNCSRVMELLSRVAAIAQSTLIIATHDHRLKSIVSKQIVLTNSAAL